MAYHTPIPAKPRFCACPCGGALPRDLPRGSQQRKYLEGHSPKYARAIDASSLSETSVVAFWRKTRIGDNGRCLEWTGTRDTNGYGLFRDPDTKRLYRAHRLAHALLFGPLPAGVQVNHRCDVSGYGPSCVNPLHAVRGSQSDNMQDAVAAGFSQRKLSPSMVLEIRELRRVGRVGRSALAEKFGISEVMVDRILKGRAWLHLLEPGAVTASFWARKGECDRGHAFTPENSLISASGRRRCRTCKLEWRRVHRGVSSARSHCFHGHPLDEANTRIDRAGYRLCRTCQRDYGRAYLARKREAAA